MRTGKAEIGENAIAHEPARIGSFELLGFLVRRLRSSVGT
jgi:hypothetical protein